MSDLQLIEAVKAGDRAAALSQLGSGAQPDQRDEQGWTPLCWAAGRGDAGLVSALVEAGADVFAAGRDQRTPYMIALAAGHAEVARALREAERRAQPERVGPERLYCKAYTVGELKGFPALAAKLGQSDGGDALADDDVLFIHQDYTVTRSMWHNEDVLFDDASPQWREFCTQTLGFAVPDDLDLIVPPEVAPQSQATT